MGNFLADRDVSPYSKRQKLHGSGTDQAPDVVPAEIESSKDLRRLLSFSQEDGALLRQKIHHFKAFLDSIAYSDDVEGQSLRRGILLDYLQSQRKDRVDEQSYLSDLIQSWSFAAQANNENLYSAVVAVLALFLKTISGSLDFRDYGNQLCRTLLEPDQLKLLERGLSGSKVKEHVVSPCLRLLTEIVSHDGGTAAKAIWRCREVTFKHFELFLNMRKDHVPASDGSKRKPSVRDNALRCVFANLRCQSSTAKAGILQLAQGKVARSVFKDLQQDAPSIVIELLSVFKKAVLSDDQLPRHSKTTLFREGTLSQVAFLYQQDDANGSPETKSAVQEAAHLFLLQVCTSSRFGILERSQDAEELPEGAVPSFNLKEDIAAENELPANHERRTSPKNRTVVTFLQGLKPYKRILDKDLILACFQAAPNLLADYFKRNTSFTFDPKLSATWVGYCMFLISVIQLPISETYLLRRNHGESMEQSVDVDAVIETILPSPLTQKSVTKAINQACGFVKFCAVKVLIAAFKKYEELLARLQAIGKGRTDPFGKSLSSQLSAAFVERCPEMRHIIAGFQGCSNENPMLRESFTRLLALYYRAIPQIALQERVDISHSLARTMPDYNSNTNEPSMDSLELASLLDIAEHSMDMDWWHKSASMSLSPFTTVLRTHLQSSKSKAHVPSVLQRVAEENHLTQPSTSMDLPSICVLYCSLEDHGSSDELYKFLDNCILQCQRKSVLYDEARRAFIDKQLGVDRDATADIDLLLFAIADQWPFMIKAADKAVIKHITRWVVDYLNISRQAGKDHASLSAIRTQISESMADEACRQIINSTSTKQRDIGKYTRRDSERDLLITSGPAHRDPLANSGPEQYAWPLPQAPPEEDEDHRILSRWKQESIPEVVLEGSVGELMLCLCSKYMDIRRQALSALRALRDSFSASDWIGATRVYLVIGEIIETVESRDPEHPLPYFAAVFGARSCSVYADPLHPMYMKIHKYVMKGPEWDLHKLPSCWVDRVLLHPPTEDDGYRAEVEWMLDFLIDGLRAPMDMEIYLGRGGIFDRLLTLFASPSLSRACRKKILHLLHRCTYVDGSTALITRCGVLSWIKIHLVIGSNAEQDFLLRSLASRLHDTCDKSKIDEWSGSKKL